VVEVEAAGQSALPGVANYGLRPTVGVDHRPLLEVHLLNKTAVTYGDKLSVKWLHFLRPESKFGGLEELRAQVAVDRQQAVEYFANQARG